MNTYTKLTRAVLAAGLIVLGLGLAKEAHAVDGTTDTIRVTVTPDVQYSVKITSPMVSGYNFGLVRVGISTLSTVAIAVQNNGDIAEYFSMAVNDITGGGNAWTNNGGSLTPGTTSYVMQGYFQTTGTAQPDSSSLTGANQNIPTTPPTTANGKFGQGSQTAAGASQDLWLRLHMPTAVNDSGQHTLVLAINGQNL